MATRKSPSPHSVVQAHQAISKYSRLTDEEIPLLEVALMIALIEYPKLNVRAEYDKIDQIVAGAAGRVRLARDGEDDAIKSINSYLFTELGFRGDNDDYYNPRNSLLNNVVERRRGIPITLSAIYLEVAWTVGVDAFGVGFPGHFIVGFHSQYRENRYLDPFNDGRELDRGSMQEILDRIYGGRMAFDESFLRPTTKRMILVRMLNNLRSTYLQDTGDLGKALEVLNCICVLTPDSSPEVRDRGLLNFHLQKYEAAIRDLLYYLKIAPHAADADSIRVVVEQIQSTIEKGR